jgi:phosphohistidine phosphatase
MKTILLVRHAKSSWDDPAVSDFDRTLNSRGLRDAPAMANRLQQRIPSIHRIYSSTAQRARSTAGIFAEKLHYRADQIVFEHELYLAPPRVFADLIARCSDADDCVMIVAHNPGITDFANRLTNAIRTDNMPTCSIFAVSANINSWTEFEGAEKQFLFFDYPKAAIGN